MTTISKQDRIAELIRQATVIPVLTIERLADAVPLAKALVAGGVPAAVAGDIVALTLGVVRGMALRTLWDNDPNWFDQLFGLWRRMIKIFLEAEQKRGRLR